MRRIARTSLRIVLVVATAACGTYVPASELYTSADRDCQSAATLLRQSPGGTPEMPPPLRRIRNCPDRAGALLATLLDTSRQVADTTQIERRFWLTQYVHDGEIYRAALAVARDPSATPAARIGSLRTLLWMKSPGRLVSLTSMMNTPSCPPPCVSSFERHFYALDAAAGDTIQWPLFGRPMPAGYAVTIDSVATALQQSDDTPSTVRRAADHVLKFPLAAQLGGR